MTERRKLFLLILMGMLLPVLAGAQTHTKTFSLEEAQKYAVENSYDIRQALLAIDIADKQKWEVTASGFPQISISAQYQKFLDIPTQLIPGEIFGEPGKSIPVKFGKPHNASYGVSASQLIFSGSYFVGLQASSIYLRLSQQSLERTRYEIRETVANTYALVLVAEENRSVLTENLKNVSRTLYEISEMHKEGFVESTDVKQLQISKKDLENGISALDQQIEVAYKLLKLQMGIDVHQPVQLSDSLSGLLTKTADGERLDRPFDVHNSISYKLMDTQERLADLSMKNEMTTFLPNVAAFGTMSQSAQRDEFNLFDSNEKWFPTTVVGLQLSWPIFSGGAKIFRVQKAKLELKSAQVQKAKAEQGLQLEYDQTRSALISAWDRYANARSSRDLAKEVYEITLEKYKEGVSSSMDLTQGHMQYLQSEGNYLQSASALLAARVKMDRLLATM
jgi:outer membrane protein